MELRTRKAPVSGNAMTILNNHWKRAVWVCLTAWALAGCGGADSPDGGLGGSAERSTLVFQDGAPGEGSTAEHASAKPDANLTTQALDRAEAQAQKADATRPLESLSPGAIAPKSAYVSGAVVRKALVRLATYRFYNRNTGAHFYTISTSERDNLLANASSPFSAGRHGVLGIRRGTRRGCPRFTDSSTPRLGCTSTRSVKPSVPALWPPCLISGMKEWLITPVR
jgi:hypothetical protein